MKDHFKYETANQEIPKIWKKFFMENRFSKIKAKYAVNIDNNMGSSKFDYMIGDDYNETLKVPKAFEIIEIPKFTWVVFSCVGSASVKMQETNELIFKEWLPNSNEYEIAAGYNIEMYSNPDDYRNGTDDEEYHCEIWIPIKKK